ncbi:undecaprenyldiphospho-muramoylpentapeptide beta-N-acetylglucosaminyltransferase [Liquorilactobacillus oeni]|uniref:UDP-N-acetylglucosamine--N-acetylmuramyl-(pentapeptide) pyrophosphoryl-undecaprenol N-acetylglucosamine transferase n=1 Tax=Liquorilactobacillus oeni DSM 19972 TaxID=1423777 RepID=A0A0R1M8K1_9LACO|nr:undecaprenyldiphospho-muramoylpentapeptide beta-N-acetylglucosaminyltransferase [Liquorilactobacillus oeni]KRL04669.1 undecaprenyldiphospho-muramoylpentapeptide beta-N- acetylglucosaminyltransferase [Liquorilactobacillus oeni DSM 19972]
MRILISGGGTGGHIYPALALIEALKKHDPQTEVLYVGTHKGLENKIVPAAGIAFRTIKIQGFKRSLSLENFKTVYLFLKSVHDAKKIIKDFKPEVVVGTGGYVCGAVVYAAARLKIPTFIHEQNSIAGITNKFLSHFVDKIGICFKQAEKEFPAKKVIFTGNPRAQQVADIVPSGKLRALGLDPTKKTVLIFGGSRGARRINEASVEAFKFFGNKEYQILFVTGSVHYDKIMRQVGAEIPQNVLIKPYLPDMPGILPEITCIVGRAGATSLAEITALGIPSVLIPSPYVTHDHQTHNAQSLVEIGAAKMIAEKDLTGARLAGAIDELFRNDQLRKAMSKKAKEAGVPDAATRIEKQLQQLIAAH